MDEVLTTMLQDIFDNMDRGLLASRNRRNEVVEYILVIIQGCANAELCDPQLVSEKVVRFLLDFHDSSKESNCNICLFGKFHDLLYIAVRLCYNFQIQNEELITRLLQAIYNCEMSFDRLFCVPIFGAGMSYMVSGWRPDFTTREEGHKALEYFLHLSSQARCFFMYKNRLLKFPDVPIENYGHMKPIGLSLMNGRSSVFHSLLKYGSEVNLEEDYSCVVSFLKCLWNHWGGGHIPPSYQLCLKYFLRAVPTLSGLLKKAELAAPPDLTYEHLTFISCFLPPSRNGECVPELKHLSRLAVRSYLTTEYRLPNVIYELHIPTGLQAYLLLEED